MVIAVGNLIKTTQSPKGVQDEFVESPGIFHPSSKYQLVTNSYETHFHVNCIELISEKAIKSPGV